MNVLFFTVLPYLALATFLFGTIFRYRYLRFQGVFTFKPVPRNQKIVFWEPPISLGNCISVFWSSGCFFNTARCAGME